MLYDLSNILDQERFKDRCNALYRKGCTVELTEKTHRTLRQNAYLYLILGWFALEYGETVEYVKQEYFKRLVNRDLFVERKQDRYLGQIEVLKSSRDLTKEQMSVAISRFKDWSLKEAGIRLPDANEDEFLRAIEIELNKRQRYI